ncbi:hypothetical protein HPP92_008363 [Vanilla planifolia]|uniref:Uncharacterized protein n=1 Tax=Vanilla planifolia TaxID=51239 RepID=A0A835V5H7_VANPL|nr:hypothetical protein HPP92_008559 [Vanilla planifolia]KAG0486268.1 hypothetical protein HPP92_008363 [Vanilla planifolia]
MYMATDPNMNSHHRVFPSTFCNQRVVSFQSGTINSATGLVHGGISNPAGVSGSANMILAGDSGALNNTSMLLEGNTQGNFLLEPMAGLRREAGLAVDWSYNEQQLLYQGLKKYADQPSIMKYIKIAALLPEKSVRDVALRCRWMSRKENGKRLKIDDHCTAKKFRDRKERMLDSSTQENIHKLRDMTGYPFVLQNMNPTRHFLSKTAPIIDDTTRQLLEENALVLSQIADNIKKFKIQDNVDLLLCSRNNIHTILNSMSGMPGIMSHMPPLPVTVSEDIFTSLIASKNQAFMFSSQTAITVKEEPRS